MKDKIDKKELRELYLNQCMPPALIAKKLKKTPAGVYWAIDKYGLTGQRKCDKHYCDGVDRGV